MSEAKFTIGQIVEHLRFNYRGVIFDVDYKFLGTDEWYDNVALSRPPKNQPWYHVLVNDAIHQTYVAESNLEPSIQSDSIHHPLLPHYFSGMVNGIYQSKTSKN